MKITKREIIASVSIVAIMLLIGFLIVGKISDNLIDANDKYNKATKIESAELFKYGMDTSIGNAFIYGDLKAVDAVAYPEISGKYLSIAKNKERYTMHTRQVSYRVGKSTHHRTETYWTWDTVQSESLVGKKVTFCGQNFNYSQFNRQGEDHITTINESPHIRYQYYGCKPELKGTIFACLLDRNISKDGAMFYKDMTIDKTMKLVTSDSSTFIFWIFWIIFILGLVALFYYFDNKWLEN